mmetsp:Transcript_56642/g.168578  ORF Transcript_56642/g.168578 Transcript_56642/m.168578 type:complete len:454 (+) Transcript_56642:61-1422(+)
MAPKARGRLAMPRKGYRSRSKVRAPLSPPGEPLAATQVSLGFDRAHHKVWDFFREKNTLILTFRQSAQGRTIEMVEGKKLIVYVPQSQGGFGLVGLGMLTGSPTVLEQGGDTPADGLCAEFRALMRSIYTDPKNKPSKRPRCSSWRFRMHREQIVGKGCGTSSTPWEFGVEAWATEDAFSEKWKGNETAMVRLPVEWEATVPYEQGIFSIDWASLGLADFPFKVCQLSSIFHRRLTTEHWAVMSARLKVLSASLLPPSPSEEGQAGPAEEVEESTADGPNSKEPQTENADPKEPCEGQTLPECLAGQDPQEPTDGLASPQRQAHGEDPKEAAAGKAENKEPRKMEETPKKQVPEKRTRGPYTRRRRATELNTMDRRRRAPRAAAAASGKGPGRKPCLHTMLKSLGLDKYYELLQREEVDLDALRLLSDRDLADLGLPLGPRRKLQAAIRGDKG